MKKYKIDIYPIKAPIIEMGYIDRNKFLNNAYCFKIRCDTKGMLQYEITKFLNKFENSYYGFYIYDVNKAYNEYVNNASELLKVVDEL